MKTVLLLSLFCLLSLGVTINHKCGEEVAPYDNCASPQDCGSSSLGCTCSCGACGSCVFAKNPIFDKKCAANVVLVLDESSSIGRTYAPDVMLGATSFWTQFAQVNDIGGSANLAVIKFSNDAEIVNAGQPVLSEMKKLDAGWITSLNNFIDDSVAKPSGYSTYRPFISLTEPSCTNWGAALELVKETPWCYRTPENPGACTPTTPDIVIWFTDGEPTMHDGTCDHQCNAQRTRADNSGPVGPDNGGDLGVACHWADDLKIAGTKLFIIGIGQSASFVNNIEKVTGPVLWEPRTADLFSVSDYVIDPNFEDLGAIFFTIAQGLCDCLQDQAPCFDEPSGNFPSCADQANFDARVRITTGADATIYPVNSVNHGFTYYGFGEQPPALGVEIQAPGSDLMTENNLVTTTVFDSCSVIRKEICGDRCFAVADKTFLPRLFISAGDVQQAPAGGLVSDCGVPYIKGGNLQPESIEYIWLRGTGSNTVICAARAKDGTLYEFWQDNFGNVPGVNYRKPVHISQGNGTFFDFERLGCTTFSKCSSPVELLYVVDSQFTADDYDYVKNYITDLIASYDNSGNTIRAAIQLNNVRIPATGFYSDLGQLTTAFNLQAQGTGPTDFYGLVNEAIDHLWPNDFVKGQDVPRYMLTVIGGPDSHGAWTLTEVTDFRAKKAARGLESWVIGVANGATELDLVRNIADNSPPAAYNHYDVLGKASLLPVGQETQALRMCPSKSLCDESCQGFCACGECLCPDCITPEPENKCLESCCDASSKICTVKDKAVTHESGGGCVPANPDPCVSYTCEASTGTCGVDNTCAASCGCSTLESCFFNQLNVGDCGAACNPKAVECGCGNLCGNQCDKETGFCGGALNCDDGNSCTEDTCQVRAVGSPATPTPVCMHEDKSVEICPRIDDCTYTQCVGNASEAVCEFQNITSLIDLCGNCNGDNLECTFTQTSTATGVIIGVSFAAGFAIAAALAVAGAASYRKGKKPSGSSPLQENALMDNPAFKEPGMAGAMPEN